MMIVGNRYRAPLAIALLVAGVPAAAQTVGVNAAVVNDVRMTSQANPAPHKAVVKERVALGNDIQTGKASVLQVLLLDRTSFTVGGNARVKIDRFVYDPNRQASAVGLSVAKGAFRFMSGKALHANPGQSAISTPVASIGIRGTIVEGAVRPGCDPHRGGRSGDSQGLHCRPGNGDADPAARSGRDRNRTGRGNRRDRGQCDDAGGNTGACGLCASTRAARDRPVPAVRRGIGRARKLARHRWTADRAGAKPAGAKSDRRSIFPAG